MAFLVLSLVLCLAFANGANDIAKGTATLVGSGDATQRHAAMWGTLWTVAGGIAAAFIARAMLAVFSTTTFLATPPTDPAFMVAVACGAIGWLVIATATGLPVSTTHAIIGGLVGAGVVAVGVGGVHWAPLARRVALPLLLSPVLAFVLVSAILPATNALVRRFGGYCVCVERSQLVMAPATAGPAIEASTSLHVITGASCPPDVVTRIELRRALHWMSAGLTSFSRGTNDTPKILALGLAPALTLGLDATWAAVLVAGAMGCGSLLAGRKVTQTMGHKITRISAPDGLAANVTTSLLVGLATTIAAPVSTTHVSTGAIIGIGLHRRATQWRLVRDVVLAWCVTLPVAAGIAALILGMAQQ